MITLGIIGVVAAITIPGLVTSYQKIMAVNRLKHTYAILSQAIQLQKAETGMDILEFDTLLEPKEFMKKYINPYLKVIGECTTQAQCYGNRPIIALDRESAVKFPDNEMYFVKLINGSYFGITRNFKSAGILFFVDIDGRSGYNMVGRDIFSLYLLNINTINPDNKDVKASFTNDDGYLKTNPPSGLYFGGYAAKFKPHALHSRDEMLGKSGNMHRACSKEAPNTSKTTISDACAALIKLDGWRISKDYPW